MPGACTLTTKPPARLDVFVPRRFLRSSENAAEDQEGLLAVLGAENLNVARHVLRLVLLEDRVFRT